MRFQSFRLLLRAASLLKLVGNRQGFPWRSLSTMQASPTLSGTTQGQDTSSPASREAPTDASHAQHPSPSHLQEWALQEAAAHALSKSCQKQGSREAATCQRGATMQAKLLRIPFQLQARCPNPGGKGTMPNSSISYKTSWWAP